LSKKPLQITEVPEKICGIKIPVVDEGAKIGSCEFDVGRSNRVPETVA